MRVTIEITEKGYSKTVEMNDGTKLIQKWEKAGNGFSTTDDSVNFNDTELLPETIEALECDFELCELSNAIENENAEIFDYGEVPTTEDGHILKRGDTFYTIAVTHEKGKMKYIPLKLKFPLDYDGSGSSNYFSKEKCIDECNEINAINNKA